ncbi:MAG: 3-isopropylmalate dehydratase small subunit 1 [Polaribacter sp. SA4-10]|nr:MAG: 3-isopropylmalate dehydratase small subunit 1 [Polaribacter sp. SA4-10]
MNIGVLPVQVSSKFLGEIFKVIQNQPLTELTVDLHKQNITISSSGKSEAFEINDYKKNNMLNGYDDIDFLSNIKTEIEGFALNTPL